MRRFWHAENLPYLALIATTPLIIWPLAVYILSRVPECAVDEPWWKLGNFELAVLPFLAGLLPFAWLLSLNLAVRKAAIISGVLGAFHFGIIQAATILYSTANPDDEGCTISIYFALGVVFPLTLALWVASAVIAGVLMVRAGRGSVRVSD